MNSALRTKTGFLTVALLSIQMITVACNKSSKQPAADQNATNTAQTSAPQQGNAPQLSADDLVAPIALYPDQLLAQVMTAATNPQEVLDGGNWLIQNQNLKGDALTAAAKQAGFTPSMQYLMSFPQVVDNMCQEMDWTTQLGEAFKADQKSLMDAVQRKRAQAQQMGNLTSSPQMTVDTKQADNGEKYVEIKPAQPQVVYVPQYNPVTIYNTPAPAAPAPATTTTTTVEQQKSGVSTGAAVGIGLLSFGIGMAVGNAIGNNHDDYYPYPYWGHGGMYYGGRPYYPPPYRPAYPGYHPAPYYRPPANYGWSQHNRQVNVNVNNNYYNQFNNNRTNNIAANNNRVGTVNNNRVGTNNQGNFRGQTTYQGAHPNTLGQKPGASMANAIPQNQQLGNRNTNNQLAARNESRPNTGSSNLGANRASTNNMTANRTANRPNNVGASPAARPATTASAGRYGGGDRGYSAPSPSASRPQARPASAPAPSPQRSEPNRGGGFGSGNSGKSDRAASSRGRSSMGASGGGRHHR